MSVEGARDLNKDTDGDGLRYRDLLPFFLYARYVRNF